MPIFSKFLNEADNDVNINIEDNSKNTLKNDIKKIRDQIKYFESDISEFIDNVVDPTFEKMKQLEKITSILTQDEINFMRRVYSDLYKVKESLEKIAD